MPKPHARATRAISPGHLPMMVRLLARRMRQWHEHLPLTLLGPEDIVLHNPDRVKTPRTT